MERHKKRLTFALTGLSNEVVSVKDGVARLETRARGAVEAASEETDPDRFATLYDDAQREIEKVLTVIDDVHELLSQANLDDSISSRAKARAPTDEAPNFTLQEALGSYVSRSDVDLENDRRDSTFFRPIGRAPEPAEAPRIDDVSSVENEERNRGRDGRRSTQTVVACPFASNHDFDASEFEREALTPLAELPPLQPIDGSFGGSFAAQDSFQSPNEIVPFDSAALLPTSITSTTSITSSTTSKPRVNLMAPRKVTSEPEPLISVTVPTYVSALTLNADDLKFDVDETQGLLFMFSHIVDPGLFHVHPIIGNDVQLDRLKAYNNLEIDRLNNFMYSFYAFTRLEDLHRDFYPTVGDVVVAHFTGDGNFYRAIIKDIRHEIGEPVLYFVFYFDYGNTEWTNLHNLAPLLQQFSNFPPQSVKCQMGDFMPKQGDPGWSPQDGQTFKESIAWNTWYHGFPTRSSVNVDPRVTDTLPLLGVKKVDESNSVSLRMKLFQNGIGRLVLSGHRDAKDASTVEVPTSRPSGVDARDNEVQGGEAKGSGGDSCGVPLLDKGSVTPANDVERSNGTRFLIDINGAVQGDSPTSIDERGSLMKHDRRNGDDNLDTREDAAHNESKMANLKSLGLEDGKWFVAEVISFRNPGMFYVSLPFGRIPIASTDDSLAVGDASNVVDKEERDGNKQLQAALNEFYRDSPEELRMSSYQVVSNELVVSKFDSKTFLRTKILSVDRGRAEAKVFYVDFGNTQTVSLSAASFLRLDDRFLVSFFAVPCYLANVEPKDGRKWTNDAKSWFKQKVDGRQFMLHVRNQSHDECPVVDMWDTLQRENDDGDDVLLSEELVKLGFAQKNYNNFKKSPSVSSTLSCYPCR